MMSKEFLKKIGILGVSFGLIASPLAFADMHDEEYEPQDPAPQEEEWETPEDDEEQSW